MTVINKMLTQLSFETLFDLEDAKKTNILVSGSNASGKTLLSCGIASLLHRLNYRVIVFDVSGAWKKKSDLDVSKVYSTRSTNRRGRKLFALSYRQLRESGIYDLSLLNLTESKRLVEDETLKLWDERAKNDKALNNMWLIFEESEIYLRNIRGGASENVYRVIHVGRNMNIRGILITTDLAMLDANVIRLCDLRFHGSMGIEENSKRKFRNYYGAEYTDIAMKNLGVGDFIRYQKKSLDIIHVPEFNASTINVNVNVKEVKPRIYEKGLWNAVKNIF